MSLHIGTTGFQGTVSNYEALISNIRVQPLPDLSFNVEG